MDDGSRRGSLTQEMNFPNWIYFVYPSHADRGRRIPNHRCTAVVYRFRSWESMLQWLLKQTNKQADKERNRQPNNCNIQTTKQPTDQKTNTNLKKIILLWTYCKLNETDWWRIARHKMCKCDLILACEVMKSALWETKVMQNVYNVKLSQI